MADRIYRMEKFPVTNLFHFPSVSSPYALVIVFLLYVLAFFPRGKRQRILPEIPIAGVDGTVKPTEVRDKFRHGSKDILEQGYEKVTLAAELRNMRLTSTSSKDYVEELENEPNERADFPATFVEMFEGKYTTIGTEQTLHPRIIKNQLNQNLAGILSDVDDEIWRILYRSAQNGSRFVRAIFLQELSHVPQARLKDFPASLRPIAKHFIPALSKIFKHFALANALIVPIMNDRERTQKRSEDLLQWMMDNAEGRSKSVLSAINLHVAFAAIHTSAVAVTHIIYDLCAMPEYVEPLRQEIEEALAAEGGPTKKAFLKMPKLDSFMRESQRLNPLLLITYERVIQNDLVLSDGFVLPANTQIGVPAHAIGLDPEIYHDPSAFDGYRFCKMRESNPQSAGQQQYTAANLTNMSWGYGKHACPGRWFADAEIKMILVHMLLEYDLRFPDESAGQDSNSYVEKKGSVTA
ncbi:ent-kaurene oxidase [Physcia stellaris]|nr:ent-kaurene oxidase [Physcia stellaris]